MCLSAILPASAAPLKDDEALKRLQRIEAGAVGAGGKSTLTMAQVRKAARAEGVSLSELARRTEAEARDVVAPSGAAKAARSGGEDGSVQFPFAKRKGDVFVHSSTSYTVNHGHAGLYATKRDVIEAPGGDKVSREISVTERYGPKGQFWLYRVGESKKRRTAAVKRARKYYLGKPYDSNFFRNRKNGSKKLNCSELVWRSFNWASYKPIDIDANKGWGVYPRNIQDSGWTHHYGGA